MAAMTNDHRIGDFKGQKFVLERSLRAVCLQDHAPSRDSRRRSFLPLPAYSGSRYLLML